MRGQSAGAFRSDVPASWPLATLLALVHGAGGELGAGRIDEDRVAEALVASSVGAVTAPAPSLAPTTLSPSA